MLSIDQMQDAAGLDQTLNERVGGDLHINAQHEESKGGAHVIDVSDNFNILKAHKELI